MVLTDQWIRIKSKDLENFSIKYSFDGKHFFFVSNLKQVYSSAVKQEALASTCQGLVGNDDSILSMIFEKIQDPAAKATFKAKSGSCDSFALEISSQIKDSVEKITFRLENFKELGSDGVYYHLIAPLIHMQAESFAREQKLIDVITAKDETIAEYKTNGVTILPSFNTSPFHVEQLLSIRSAFSSLNEVLEKSGPAYCQALKRKCVKVEQDSSQSSQTQVMTKRTRRQPDIQAAEFMAVVSESLRARTGPKKKANVRI